MTRIPCLRQIAVLATLLTLTVVPMAGARSLGESTRQPGGDSWVAVAVRAIEGLFNPASARSHRPAQNRKDDATTNHAAGGGCIDPGGRPVPPWCF